MVELVLIRHGQTAWNQEKIFRGRTEIPLSEDGLKQAQILASSFEGSAADAVFSSPLLRAVQTAEPLAHTLEIPLYKDDSLVDVDFGYWSGLRRDEVRKRYPTEWQRWESGDLSLRFPGGESLLDVQQRLARFLDSCVRNLTDKRLLVVTHRVPLKLIMAYILHSPTSFWQFVFDTTSVSRIQHNGKYWSLLSLNDTHHLRGQNSQEDF